MLSATATDGNLCLTTGTAIREVLVYPYQNTACRYEQLLMKIYIFIEMKSLPYIYRWKEIRRAICIITILCVVSRQRKCPKVYLLSQEQSNRHCIKQTEQGKDGADSDPDGEEGVCRASQGVVWGHVRSESLANTQVGP